MPDPNEYDNQDDFMKVCIPQCMGEGLTNDQAVGKCMGLWNERGKHTPMMDTAKAAVKAVGEWELDVLAVPFGGKDSDGQFFDANTDIMEQAFSTPLGVYQHGVKQGAKGLQEKIIIIGKTIAGSLNKQSDGWHLRMVLDKGKKEAKAVMEAAWKGLVAVSSDSISHLARLEVAGKLIQYEKNRAGRIAIWPLAGVSLWEKGNGNLQPASKMTYALPAMKAIYRDAELPFPDKLVSTDGALSEAYIAAKRARREEILSQAKVYLLRVGEEQE